MHVTQQRLRMSALLLVSVLWIALAAAPPAVATRTRVRPKPCTRARIGGRIRCLRPGRVCQPRYESAYVQYGFVCARGRDGRYRLRARIFVGPPAA